MWAKARTRGFTIVELLIVIVIIGILAALVIVAYNGIQNRARASQASSALTQAKKKLELYKVDNGSYPTTGNLSTAGVVNGDTTYQYTSDGTTYCMTATAATVSYKATETTSPASGGCAGHGQGGVAAITNLIPNPGFESDTSSWTDTRVNLAQSSTGVAGGSSSGRLTPIDPTNADAFIQLGSTSSLITGLNAGSTYTVAATIYVPATQTGTLDARARGITVYSWNGGTPTGVGQSSFAANSTGSSRLSTTFTIPSGATGLVIRLYNGATTSASNLVYWDNIMLTSGSTTYNYGDGNSSNWIWNGATNNSNSTGPPL